MAMMVVGPHLPAPRGEPGGQRLVAATVLAQPMEQVNAAAMGLGRRPVAPEQHLPAGHPPAMLLTPDLAHRFASTGRTRSLDPGMVRQLASTSAVACAEFRSSCARLSPSEGAGASARP